MAAPKASSVEVTLTSLEQSSVHEAVAPESMVATSSGRRGVDFDESFDFPLESREPESTGQAD